MAIVAAFSCPASPCWAAWPQKVEKSGGVARPVRISTPSFLKSPICPLKLKVPGLNRPRWKYLKPPASIGGLKPRLGSPATTPSESLAIRAPIFLFVSRSFHMFMNTPIMSSMPQKK